MSGRYTVVASAPGFTSTLRTDVEVEADAPGDPLTLRLWAGGKRLSGRVLDRDVGPIPGALVTAVWYQPLPDGTHERREFQVEANADGAFEVYLPPGRYKVTAQADGYAPQTQSLGMELDRRKDFLLDPAARIAGRVIDASGAAVAGAEVRLAQAERRWATMVAPVTSDEQGAFAFDSVAPGTFRLLGRRGDLVGVIGPLTLEATGRLADLELKLDESCTVEGQVTGEDGRPISQARVALASDDAGVIPMALAGASLTDEQGRYRKEGLLPGRYLLGVTAPGFAPHRERLAVARSERRDVPLLVEAKIAGVVLTADGQPVAEARVAATVMPDENEKQGPRSMGNAVSDAQGRFAIGGLGTGRARVTAEHRNEVGQVMTDALAPGATAEVTLRLGPGGEIAGMVIGADGRAAAGVIVLLRRDRSLTKGSRADGQGRFAFKGVAPGPVWLRAERVDEPPSFNSSPADEQELTVEPGGRITGVKLLLGTGAATAPGQRAQ